MKKRFLAMFVALSMIFAATGCGKKYTITEDGAVYNDYVQVSKWKGLEVEKVEPMAVTEEEIDAAIVTDIQSEWKKVGIKDRAAIEGDTVIINFEGKKDGVAFPGGTAENAPLKLGSGDFIDGFEDGIIGHTPGDTFDLNLTFPAEYGNAELAGQAVVFTVTLNAIQPEYSEALLPMLSSKATTTDEYRAEKKAEIEKSNREAADEQMRTNLLGIFFEQCEAIDYPEKELKELLPKVKKYYKEQLEYFVLAQTGMTLEAYMESTGAKEEDVLGATYEEIAQYSLLQKYSLRLVLDVEEVSYGEDEYKKFLKEEAERQLIESIEEVEEALESYYGPGGAEVYFLQMKVADILWENCKIVEPTETETETVTE